MRPSRLLRSKWLWVGVGVCVVAAGSAVYFFGTPWSEVQLSLKERKELCVEAMEGAIAETAGAADEPTVERLTFKGDGNEYTMIDGYSCEVKPDSSEKVGDWYLDDDHRIAVEAWVVFGKNRKAAQESYEDGLEGDCPTSYHGPDSTESVGRWRDTEMCRVRDMHINGEDGIATSAISGTLVLVGDYSVTTWMLVHTIRPDGEDTAKEDLAALTDVDPKIESRVDDIENAMLDPILDRFGKPEES